MDFHKYCAKSKNEHKWQFFSFTIIFLLNLKSFPLMFSAFNFYSLGTFHLENTTSGNELNNIYCIRYMQVIIAFQLAKLTRYPQVRYCQNHFMQNLIKIHQFLLKILNRNYFCCKNKSSNSVENGLSNNSKHDTVNIN